MKKDDDQLARLGESFSEADVALSQKRAEEAAVRLAADRAEAERLRLARKNLPGTERGILELFRVVNRDIFRGTGRVSKWEDKYGTLDGGDIYIKIHCHRLSFVLRDHGFNYTSKVTLGRESTERWNEVDRLKVGDNVMKLGGGSLSRAQEDMGVTGDGIRELIGLEEDSSVVVEKMREGLLEEIERRFGRR